MKKILNIALVSAIFFVSCGKDDKSKEIIVPDFGLLVLNEGFWGHVNTSSITLYDFETKTASEGCAFFSKNQRRLGDTPNDILVYDEKIYISVGGESVIEVADLDLKSIRQIPLKNGENNREPHGLAAHNGKIYIACFDGYLARLDISSFALDFVKVGRNPGSIAISKNHAYVTNSGGLDFPNYDNTVSVVDLATFTEVKKIEVGPNPFAIGVDETGHIIVSLAGDHATVLPSLHRINTTNNTYDRKFEGVAPADFAMKGNVVYFHDFSWITFSGEYAQFNTVTGVRTSLSADLSGDIFVPYGINVNQENGDIYASCSVSGEVFIIDKDGIQAKFTAGAMPKRIVVLKK